ncbi:hypothetical protein MADRUGA_75 [Mycobacterium phage Madruga]|uniref:Uncharacterized protein n=1 Tax=Mycobacterium phage Madruga TaxID=1675552 RepID=A0A0K1LTA3_9CAUD|nr:hypothetical protein MADRUGA_75 [Mycobacterium phage Madruga]
MIENDSYEMRFKPDELALDSRQILYSDRESALVINKALADAINENSVGHELWIADETLSLYFNRIVPMFSARWNHPGGIHHGKVVEFSLVEQIHEPENNRRGLSLKIEGYKKFIWVFHLHPQQPWYDRRLNLRLGVWPD